MSVQRIPSVESALGEFVYAARVLVRAMVHEEVDARFAELAPTPQREWLTYAETAKRLGLFAGRSADASETRTRQDEEGRAERLRLVGLDTGFG